MKIIAFVGVSGSGKTRLIAGLITEFKRRGLKTCALKHSSHGFALDTEGKDTWKFAEAGADGVAMAGPGEWAVRRRDRDGSEPELGSLARRFFADADVVLVEGGKATPLRKIEVMRAGVSGDLLTPAENLLAIVSDAASPAPASVPIFRPLQTAEICDLILSHEEDAMSEIMLEVDGQEVNLNPFVRTIFENTIRGMVASLSGLSPDPEAITVVIRRAKAEPGKK